MAITAAAWSGVPVAAPRPTIGDDPHAHPDGVPPECRFTGRVGRLASRPRRRYARLALMAPFRAFVEEAAAAALESFRPTA
jgi:hypothetical protein